ncbi:L-threonylcarbamoyladenylate synthase [Salinirubellus sp. GCM10025818]|uniref:L-threonylcarbamoyladenylate synthase n=1 Tax=Salinirubellus TaxID=2162630 RepID=UPI0030CAFB9D
MPDRPDGSVGAETIERAGEAIREGRLVVYPTDTVYGLGANALDPETIEQVFEAKGRSRDRPLSLGVPDVETALEYADPTDREERFMRAFLPGPVTVVVERREPVPDALTAGRDRVGLRIPDHDVSLAFYRAADRPVTATSANRSGEGSARTVAEIDRSVREAAVVLDAGETPGTESTVVDPSLADPVIREGAVADDVREWLRD